MTVKTDLIIMGAGPAGLTASIYASRFGIKHLVIGSLTDGRMAEAHLVGNFPTEGEIKGTELIKKMERRVKDFGAEIRLDKATKVTRAGDDFLIKTMTGVEYAAKALLLAIGIGRKKLNVSGEEKFFGKGVSYCATCDGKFFTNKIVGVIGGSGAALNTAHYLAGLAKKVYLICGESELKADKVWQEKVKKNPGIEIILKNRIKELKGDRCLETAVLEKNYQHKKELKMDGVFVEMGIAPNSEIVEDLGIEKDKAGFIKIKEDGSTSVKGIWAAGDITTGSNGFRQIITACSEGAIAASSIYSYLKQN
jgi:thioredoxin reductase (NADPH)